MAAAEVELRLAALEAEVAQLKQRLEENVEPKKHWVDKVAGAFADDPDFLEAMRLGREYRESLRPKPAKRSTKQSAKQSAKSRKRRNVRPRH
jgi:hypothetical protein